MKKVLATLLCATLVFSSGGFSTTVHAEEMTPSAAIVSEAGESQEGASLGAASEIQSQDEGVKENEQSEEASSEAATDESSEAASEESSEENSEDASDASDSASSAASSEDASDASDSASSAASGEDAADASDSASSAISGEDAADAASTLISGEDAADAASSGKSGEKATDAATKLASDESKLLYTNTTGSPCFEVDANGVLGLKSGYSLPTTVVVPAEAKVIPRGLFTNSSVCTVIKFEKGSQLETIEPEAFKACAIKEISIPEGVTEISANAFMDCSKLETITFEDGSQLKKVCSAAFQNTAITSFRSNTVTAIESSAFAGCKSLKSVILPKVESIGNYAFNGCSNLSSASVFSGSLASIGDFAFMGCAFTSLYLTDLSAGVSYGESCFQDNTKLANVALPGGMSTVPKKMFYGCSRLDSVVFGNGIKTIGTSAFENCSVLTTVIVPKANVFESRAFAGCTKLTLIEIKHNDSTEKVDIEDDAFPDNKNVVMKGYELEVQNYAGRKGYTFESLKQKYSISAEFKKEQAKVELSTTKATAGTVVTAKITPVSGYVLQRVDVVSDELIKAEPTEIADKYQVFSFTMKEADAKVMVYMETKAEAVSGKLGHTFDPINSFIPATGKDGTETFDYTGRESQLVITADGCATNSWLWKFSSSNTKVATVSSTGVVRSIGEGKATINAVLKTDSSKKVAVTVQVAGAGTIDRVELTVPDNSKLYPIGGKRAADEDIDGELVPVLEFEKQIIANNAKSFEVSVVAKDKYDSVLNTTTNWKSADTSIATVSKASVSDNKNTINIKKGAVGETLITVSVLNKGEKEATKANTKSFILRILDPTPRLINSTITVDNYSTIGTEVEIVPVYGYTFADGALSLWTKNKSGQFETCEDLEIVFEDSTYRIRSLNTDRAFTKTYSGATQLYIRGNFEQNKKAFAVPITRLSVTSTALNPSLKTTGRINMFYEASASADLSGKVTLTQSLSKLTVTDVKLVSTANYKKAGSESTDTFANNFDIRQIDNTTFEITRSAKPLMKLNNRNVTSGYIYISYAGYANPIKKPINIPVSDAAPDYALDITSATASVFRSNQDYDLHLIDRRSKARVSLADIEALDLTDASTYDLFEDFDASSIAYAKSDNAIKLKVNGDPRNGRAVFCVKMSTWSRELKYTFNLRTSKSLPGVRFKTSSVTLNKTYKNQGIVIEAEKTPTSTPVDGDFNKFDGNPGDEITYKTNARQENDYKALKDAMVVSGTSIAIKLPAQDIPKGTYTFNVKPVISFGTDEMVGNNLTFRVVVAQTIPTFRLKNSTFKLNADTTQYFGIEEVETTYTIGNLPTGVVGTADDSAVVYEPANASTPALDSIAEVEFVGDKVVARLSNDPNNKNKIIANNGKTLRYKVKNLKAVCGSDVATIPDFTINLQLLNREPKVSARVTGTLNPVDANSRAAITATVSNSVSDITGIRIYEVNNSGVAYKDASGNTIAPHFDMEWDGQSNFFNLKIKSGAEVAQGTGYKLKVVYQLASSKKPNEPVSLTITPRQSLPQITTNKTTATMYAGQSYSTRYADIKISLKDTKMDVSMLKPEFDKSTPAAIKKAFWIESFDPTTGIVRVRLTNPSALVLNKTYTLTMVTKYDQQATNTTGNKFSLRVTLNK